MDNFLSGYECKLLLYHCYFLKENFFIYFPEALQTHLTKLDLSQELTDFHENNSNYIKIFVVIKRLITKITWWKAKA